MNTIVVWIIVGVVSSHTSSTSPTAERFLTKDACETVRKATEDVARTSSLRCVQATVIKER